MGDDAIEFPAIDPGLAKMRKAFDLEKIKDDWGETCGRLVKRNLAKAEIAWAFLCWPAIATSA